MRPRQGIQGRPWSLGVAVAVALALPTAGACAAPSPSATSPVSSLTPATSTSPKLPRPPHVGPPPAAAKVDERMYFVGVFGVSTVSYVAASAETSAVRLSAHGKLENGVWRAGRFVSTSNPGPSGPSFVSRFEIDVEAHTIQFTLDGAEEQAAYLVEGPDRWKTVSAPPEPVTVYYTRK